MRESRIQHYEMDARLRGHDKCEMNDFLLNKVQKISGDPANRVINLHFLPLPPVCLFRAIEQDHHIAFIQYEQNRGSGSGVSAQVEAK